MPVLSIIACGMLEDELAYVLSEDSDLTELILVENSQHFSLQRKLKSLGCLPAPYSAGQGSRNSERET